jgi:glutamate--cysteine ligase catalytic subunit
LVVLRQLRATLTQKEDQFAAQVEGVVWHPEFGAWMIESTPGKPYTNYASDLLRVERNMIMRRRRLLSLLHANEISPTVRYFCSTMLFIYIECIRV